MLLRLGGRRVRLAQIGTYTFLSFMNGLRDPSEDLPYQG